MSEITNLSPRLVWQYFDEITRVPRPSKKEGKIRAFLIDFAKKHHLDYRQDAAGNIVILKPATPGCEKSPVVILQSHMDMVCEKNSDVTFDFDNDPIRTRIDGEWVRAEGTTLGADCGIGMAAAMAMLTADKVEHGPIEALFTVDEETGLTGAFGLGEGMLTGKYLINLDSEDEGEIFIGCAGGIDTLATILYTPEPAPAGLVWFRIALSGLKGGHSGDDIDKGRGNSNKLLNRFLRYGTREFGLRLAQFDGGNLRNAIPREAFAIFGVSAGCVKPMLERFETYKAEITAEFQMTESSLEVTLAEEPAPAQVVDEVTQRRLVNAVCGVPNGVLAMSSAMPGLVETSTNLASVKFPEPGRIVVTTSQRSSVGSARDEAAASVRAVFDLGRCPGDSFGRLSGLEPQSRFPFIESGRADLRTPVRSCAESACDPCRVGVRTVPRKIPASGDGFVRSHAARRSFARRTARNPYGRQVLETIGRGGGRSSITSLRGW